MRTESKDFIVIERPDDLYLVKYETPSGVPRDDSPWFGRMRAWLLDALYPGHDVESKLWFAARVAAN
jgi:hypothetical protein